MVAVWLGAFCGLAWVSGYTLLQENVEDEYRGRTFASLTVLSRLGLFLSLTLFPILSTVYGNYGFHIGGQHFDFSGTRLALWTAGLLALAGGLNTRRLLQRHRLSTSPTPHARAEAEAAAHERDLHRLRGRGGRGQGHADQDGRGSICGTPGTTCS